MVGRPHPNRVSSRRVWPAAVVAHRALTESAKEMKGTPIYNHAASARPSEASQGERGEVAREVEWA